MVATMQGTDLGGTIGAASRFLDRVEALSPAERAKIPTQSFGSSAHTSAMLMTADELTTLKAKKNDDGIGAFLVEAEGRIDALSSPTELKGLLKSAVRAILVHDRPGLAKPAEQLYAPFEPLIPLASLAK